MSRTCPCAAMNEDVGVKTTVMGPMGESMATRMWSGYTMVKSMGGEDSSPDCCCSLARSECTDFCFTPPPSASATLAASALPSGLDAAGAVGGGADPDADAGAPTAVGDSPGGGGKVPLLPEYVESITDDEVVFRNYDAYPECLHCRSPFDTVFPGAPGAVVSIHASARKATS